MYEGFGTRYWDCCKPHCGWSSNTSTLTQVCDIDDKPFALGSPVSNGCDGGDAFMCQSNAPFAVCKDVAYGFASVPFSGDVCGKCYLLVFDGKGKYQTTEAHTSLLGKKMIVKAVSNAGDVIGDQFDILIPGGGVGAFNGCSDQWGVSSAELGAQYGGFLTACENQIGFGAPMDNYKECVRNKCEEVFQTRGLTDLYEGCIWFVDWMNAASSPSFRYEEIDCPAELDDIY